MPITDSEARFLDEISLDLPWSLVETFAGMPRWRPEDVNRGMDTLIARLREHGIPVEVHSPEIYLSIPYAASVSAGGVTYRAKPPSSSLPVPGGRTGKLVKLQANPKALRSYNRDIRTLFGGSIASVEEVKALVGGNIVVMQGFGNPALTSLIEEWGGIGLIAVNPGIDIHWGTCTTIWGSPDLHDLPRKPKIPVVAVNNPDGMKLMALVMIARIGSEVLIGLAEEPTATTDQFITTLAIAGISVVVFIIAMYVPPIIQGVVQGASVAGGMEAIRHGGQAATFAAGGAFLGASAAGAGASAARNARAGGSSMAGAALRGMASGVGHAGWAAGSAAKDKAIASPGAYAGSL
ncbi:MAG: hypothetical protein Q8M47_08650, partial [Devosia sp.]|nr:hypothetical protein [Devosia sp.]